MNSGLSSKNKGIRHRTNGPQSCRPREAWVFAPFGAITPSSAAMPNFAAGDHGVRNSIIIIFLTFTSRSLDVFVSL